MSRRPDRRSAVPLYHQIVERLKYRIATGQLRAGDLLPPLRIAAGQWGVNLHTVRKAYGELEACGLVVIRRPQGASIAATTARSKHRVEGLADFLADTARHAAEYFGLSPSTLAELLLNSSRRAEASPSDSATFVECSELQARDYARQIESRWSVAMRTCCLDQPGEPPKGPIFSTFFHFKDVRGRWPHRVQDMRFVPVILDPSVANLVAFRSQGARSSRVLVLETAAERAREAVSDLASILSQDRRTIGSHVTSDPESYLRRRKWNGVILVAPRIWARLSETIRARPGLVQLRYILEPEALGDLGEVFRWEPTGRAIHSVG